MCFSFHALPQKHFHELGNWWCVFKLPDLVHDHKTAGKEGRLNSLTNAVFPGEDGDK